MHAFDSVYSGSLSSEFDDQTCSHVESAVCFWIFLRLDVEESDSEDSEVLSRADKADESDKRDIFNEDKMKNLECETEYDIFYCQKIYILFYYNRIMIILR